nr:DUF881 domain-containing protein [Rhodococcus sp. HNM0569]
MFATTREVSSGDELRAQDSTRLSDLVRHAQAQTDDAAATRSSLQARVDELQHQAATDDADVAAALDGIDAVAADAGLTELTGPGVTITMTDAPRGADGRYPVDAAPNDLVVHQQDIQSVLNAVWTGGAEAVSMQGERIVETSAPRCVGNTLLLHGRTYSPPYVVEAIGDPDRIRAALANEPGIKVYKQYATRFGLGYAEAASAQITVPAYTGG